MTNDNKGTHLTNIVVSTSITVRLTETLKRRSYENEDQFSTNLSFKEEWLKIHGRVSNDIHEDGRHVNCHENSQQSSSKNNLKQQPQYHSWQLKWELEV